VIERIPEGLSSQIPKEKRREPMPGDENLTEVKKSSSNTIIVA